MPNKILSAVKKIVPARAYENIQWWYWSRSKPDRRYMQRIILPAMARLRPNRVLSVGTQGYCAHYYRWFNYPPNRPGNADGKCEFWTMDIVPEAAQFGSPGRHKTGSVIEVDQHFAEGFFDIILMNGVFGWGVNAAEDITKTMKALRKIMQPGGILLVGWNTDRMAVDLLPLILAEGFVRSEAGGLPAEKRFEKSTHVYDYFVTK